MPRSRLDLLRPNVAARVEDKQLAQKHWHDQHARTRSFEVYDAVFVRNFGRGDKWMAGTVEEVTGPLSFHVRLEGGRLVLKHMDHIRRRTALPGGNQVLPEANVQEDHEPIAISPEENVDSVQDMQDKSEAAIEKPALESNNKI